MDWIVITGLKPYDGRYALDVEEHVVTTREWGWIKRLSGYMPLTITEGLSGYDPELVTVLALIALRRAGKIETAELQAIFERIADAPFGITLESDGEPDDESEENDAGPPAGSSNGSESVSGGPLSVSSAPSAPPPRATGAPGSATSGSAPPMLGS